MSIHAIKVQCRSFPFDGHRLVAKGQTASSVLDLSPRCVCHLTASCDCSAKSRLEDHTCIGHRRKSLLTRNEHGAHELFSIDVRCLNVDNQREDGMRWELWSCRRRRRCWSWRCFEVEFVHSKALLPRALLAHPLNGPRSTICSEV